MLVRKANTSIDAALYRINNLVLAKSLGKAHQRGLPVRLLVDQSKYWETQATRELLAKTHIPFRLLCGRGGKGSKLHHKFAIFDRCTVLTGSYNWTIESERENYDHVVILREPSLVRIFQMEFDRLWLAAVDNGRS